MLSVPSSFVRNATKASRCLRGWHAERPPYQVIDCFGGRLGATLQHHLGEIELGRLAGVGMSLRAACCHPT